MIDSITEHVASYPKEVRAAFPLASNSRRLLELATEEVFGADSSRGRGRCKDFVNYAEQHPGPVSEEALSGVRRMYDKHWPHNSTCGPMFRFLWGWLQLELEKSGEGDLSTIAEQRALIQEVLAQEGKKVTEWLADGFGGVMAVKTESLEDPNDPG